MAHFHGTTTPSGTSTQGHVLDWGRIYDPLTNILTLGHRAQIRRETVDLAQIQPGMTALEVGCGTGDVAIAAAQRTRANVCGIDPAPTMIAKAQRKATRAGVPVNFQIGVIEDLAFPDASFDVVVSSLMMHHLPHDLKQRGLAEILRVLRPGGRVLIVDAKRPTAWRERLINTVVGHAALKEGVQDMPLLLQAAGFRNIQTGTLHFPALGFTSGQSEPAAKS